MMGRSRSGAARATSLQGMALSIFVQIQLMCDECKNSNPVKHAMLKKLARDLMEAEGISRETSQNFQAAFEASCGFQRSISKSAVAAIILSYP